MNDVAVLFLLGALCALGPLALDLYLPAAGGLALEFGAERPVVAWSVVSYLLGMVFGQLLYGPFSDRCGRKPPLQVGLLLYTVAALGCILVGSAEGFIALRGLQGLGACAGMVIARAVVRDLSSGAAAARLFSQLMLVVSAAPLLAPSLGAFLLQYGGWRALFGVMAGFGVLCLLVVRRAMTESLPPERRLPASWRLAFRNYGMLMRDQQFLGYTICNGLVQAGMYAYIAVSAPLFINEYGLSPAQYGILFGVNSLGMIVAAQVNVQLIKHYALSNIVSHTLVFLLVLVLLGMLAASDGTRLPLPVLLGGLFCFLSCIGLIAPNAAALALAAHGAHAGTASALMGTLLFAIGAGCGIVVSLSDAGADAALRQTIVVVTIAAAALDCWMRWPSVAAPHA